MKTSNHLLFASGISAAVLACAMLVQEDAPAPGKPVVLPVTAPCSSSEAAGT